MECEVSATAAVSVYSGRVHCRANALLLASLGIVFVLTGVDCCLYDCILQLNLASVVSSSVPKCKNLATQKSFTWLYF